MDTCFALEATQLHVERTRAHLLDIKEMLILDQNNKKEKEITNTQTKENILESFYLQNGTLLSLGLRLSGPCLICLFSNINQNYLMNLKKSQQFVYFQNKARHYANLRSVKPAIKTYRDSHHSSTIQQSQRIPYFKRYDMERQNEGLINRLTDILSNQKTEIQKHGYTRYNRSFVPKSHLTIEQRKVEMQIDQDNNLLAQKVLNSKPSIGTIENWNSRYQELRQRKRNISKYTDKHTSKGTLVLNSSTAFIPQHYKSFLHHSAPKRESDDSLDSPQEVAMGARIKIDQLFQLPKLKKLRGSFTKIPQSDKPLL